MMAGAGDDSTQADNSDPNIFTMTGSPLTGNAAVQAPGLDDAAYSAGSNAAQGVLDAISPTLPVLLLLGGALAVILIAR